MTTNLLRLAASKKLLPHLEEALTDLGGALWADTKGNPDPVPLEVTLPDEVGAEQIKSTLAALALALGLPVPSFTLEALPEKDWVAESQKNLPPQIAGRFFVHGSHVKERPPQGLIPLLVEASIAFGTGRHETTQGCLEFITKLSERGQKVERALDLGCGSGVLALAIAKLWPRATVLAVDNDAPSVRVTAENATLNGVGPNVAAAVSEGFANPILAGARFDLIAANILAPPLIALAPLMPRHLAPGGRIVLSGLLIQESDEVAGAYRKVGLKLLEVFEKGAWRALLLGA